MSTFKVFGAVALFAAGCASLGTNPHDMSVADHRAEAARDDRIAQKHMDQSQPQRNFRVCESGAGAAAPRGGGWIACWTSVRTATQEHERSARKLHEIAAKHRAAADALVEAEARACTDLSESDRDLSPFYHREDIASAKPLEQPAHTGKMSTVKLVGATVVFRAVPGLSAELLQRLVDCHIARAAALGHDVPEMSYCPLMLKGIEARVAPTGEGLAVAIRSQEPATAKAILRRARSLLETARSEGGKASQP